MLRYKCVTQWIRLEILVEVDENRRDRVVARIGNHLDRGPVPMLRVWAGLADHGQLARFEEDHGSHREDAHAADECLEQDGVELGPGLSEHDREALVGQVLLLIPETITCRKKAVPSQCGLP